MLSCLGSQAWAADQLYYTLKAVKGSHNAYANYTDVTVDDMVWSAPGNQSLGDFWRIGGKGITDTDRDITAKTPMGSNICRVVFNHNGLSNANLTVNSITLTVASDEAFENVIDQVKQTPTINGAGSVTFEGDWATNAYYRISVNVTNTKTSNYGLDMTSIEFYKPLASTGVTDPVIKLPSGTYVGDQFVDIEGGEDCRAMEVRVYTSYPDVFSYQYKVGNWGRILIRESCTVGVTAIGAPDPDSSMPPVTSNEVFAKYVILQPLSTIAEACAAATTTESPACLQIKDWTVTGVKGSNVYFTDGINGIQLYQSGHGFEVGDVLNGQVQATLLVYNDCAELKNLTRSSEGLTVTKGEGAKPMDVVVADLNLNCQGNLIRLTDVTYDAASNVFIDGDDNEIIPYNAFITLPTLQDGKQYNVTGVAIWYKAKSKWEIAPRSEDEIELLSSQILPDAAWDVETLTADLGSVVTATFTTNSDGAVTYTSSDEAVATIDAEGRITLVGKGTATITASVAETETYLAVRKSFLLTVNIPGVYDVTFSYSDEDIQGKGESGAKGVGFTAVRGDVTLTTNNAYGNSTYIQIYGSNATAGNSTVTLTIPEPYVITDVVMTTSSADYTQTWVDQDGNDVPAEETVVSWTGEDFAVVLTNSSTKQARIKTIAVTYTKASDDAIGTVTSDKVQPAGIYDLSGRQVSKPQKGIYITAGKKVMY